MTLPKIQREIFQDDGETKKLRPEILPDNLTDEEKEKVAKDIGLTKALEDLIKEFGGTVPAD